MLPTCTTRDLPPPSQHQGQEDPKKTSTCQRHIGHSFKLNATVTRVVGRTTLLPSPRMVLGMSWHVGHGLLDAPSPFRAVMVIKKRALY